MPLDGPKQTNGSLLDEVVEWNARAAVRSRDGVHQPQVALHDPLLGFQIAAFDPSGERDLLGGGQLRGRRDFRGRHPGYSSVTLTDEPRLRRDRGATSAPALGGRAIPRGVAWVVPSERTLQGPSARTGGRCSPLTSSRDCRQRAPRRQAIALGSRKPDEFRKCGGRGFVAPEEFEGEHRRGIERPGDHPGWKGVGRRRPARRLVSGDRGDRAVGAGYQLWPPPAREQLRTVRSKAAPSRRP